MSPASVKTSAIDTLDTMGLLPAAGDHVRRYNSLSVTFGNEPGFRMAAAIYSDFR